MCSRAAAAGAGRRSRCRFAGDRASPAARGNASPSSAAAWPAWPPRTSWSSAASRSTSTSASALGGKARSIAVPGTAAGGRKPLPGRARLPLLPRLLPPRPGLDAADPVPRQPERRLGQPRRRRRDASRRGPRAAPTARSSASRPTRTRPAPRTACARSSSTPSTRTLPPHELAYFVERVMVFLTSLRRAPLRRSGSTSAGGTSSAPRASPTSTRRSLARGLTRAVVAAKETGRLHPHDRQHGRGVRLQHPGPRQRRRARPRPRTRRPTRPGSTRG